jgi:hypothetical protein
MDLFGENDCKELNLGYLCDSKGFLQGKYQ